jgi:sn-glycerol 3-phosphate transport system substrate-binding protein
MQRWFQWLLAAVLIAGWAGTASAQRIQIHWWYSNTGVLQEAIKKFIADFNASQSKYEVIGTWKGDYTTSMNQTIAAFRARQQPHVVQVFEVGTQTMMMSGAIYPVHQLMEDTGHKIDWSKYIQPVLSYYVTPDNKLLSMPFNSSTPLFYYNKEHFAKAGLKNPPKTWDEVDEYVQKLVASGQKCAFTTSWQSWVHLENYSALHGVPFASESNGFKSLKAELQFNGPLQVKHFERMNKWVKQGAMSYEGRGATPDPAFSSGKCSMITASSANIGNFTRNSKFEWSVTSLPIEKGYPVRNSIIGGATLWVLKGHPKQHYEGVAEFLNYIASPEVQVYWHKTTGYVPITITAYELAKSRGFYKESPIQEVAITQLTRAQPTELSRGLRLGNFTQIRDVIDEEAENIWRGAKTPKQGLDDAVRRGNELLRQFEQMHRQ